MSYLDPKLLRIKLINGDEASLRYAAIHAIFQSKNQATADIVKLFASDHPHRHQPIDIGEKGASTWSRWHKGAEIAWYIVGDDTLLERCELTDNEREGLSLMVRKAVSQHEKIYIVATKVEKTRSRTLPRQLTCLGLVFYE